MNEAVRCLQKLIMRGQLEDFNYVAINGMKLTDPRQSYVQILKQLDGKTVTWEQAYRILENRFHKGNSKMTLLLVDEVSFCEASKLILLISTLLIVVLNFDHCSLTFYVRNVKMLSTTY